jgi:hypothetical protein
MKGEIVLWESRKRIKSTLNEVISITFLTTEHSAWTLVPLMALAFYRITKKLPKVKLLSLRQYRNDQWRPWKMATEKMPGFSLLLSLAPPLEIKRICLALEKNSRYERIADIDVHVLYRKEKQLYKIRRIDFIDELYF